MPTTLSSLAAVARDARVLGDDHVRIYDVAYDSRAVAPGALFFCVPGGSADGHDHAPAAVARGAVALVVERPVDIAVPQVLVPRVRDAMGPMSSTFFGEPSRALTLVGVTGTNGKTTTTYMLESVFRSLDLRPGLIGTVETHIGDDVIPGTRTTPEAVDLQRLLARMRDGGVTAAAMEVSSHGLHQGRADGTTFACSIFTNLTQDHLDYHGTMEAYFEAKALLFRDDLSARAAINVDDAYGRRLASGAGIPVVTFGFAEDAAVRVTGVEMDASGSTVRIETGERARTLRVPIPARYNISNALGVVAAAQALGVDLDPVADGIASMHGVPGRLERVDEGQDFAVLVDYAHTPDSLEGVLRAARELVPGGARLIVVFGCGGDRDRGKRPLMGRAGVSLADHAIITSDNPRSEDPLSIIEQIEEGARAAGRPFASIPDRRDAIAAAIAEARAGDVVVIAGKGHETGQEFTDRTIPFDDRLVAREVLRETR